MIRFLELLNAYFSKHLFHTLVPLQQDASTNENGMCGIMKDNNITKVNRWFFADKQIPLLTNKFLC